MASHKQQMSWQLRQQQSAAPLAARRRRQRCSLVQPVTAAAPGTVALHTWSEDEYVGPLRVASIEGRGRGLVATEDVAPGQLLLCCAPLGVVTGEQQQPLEVSQLQVALASGYTPLVARWCGLLFDGTSNSTVQQVALAASPAPGVAAGQQPAEPHAWQRQQLELLYSSSGGDSSCSSGGSSSSSDASPLVLEDAALQRLMDVVRFNAYADVHDDLAAAALAGVMPVSHLGLWSTFSLLNHSCCPNAVNWVLPGSRRAMAVRAVRHIRAGDEVTISYLGSPQLLPLDARRDTLSASFDFECACGRCVSEEELDTRLAGLLHDIASRTTQSFAPRLSRALAEANMAEVAEVRRQAAAMLTLLYKQLRACLVAPGVRSQLLASVYSALEVVADADAALGDEEAAASSLAQCAAAAAAVTPGSDLHVIVAAKLAEAVRRRAAGSAAADAAWRACVDAHTLRYGRLPEELVVRLAELNRTLYV